MKYDDFAASSYNGLHSVGEQQTLRSDCAFKRSLIKVLTVCFIKSSKHIHVHVDCFCKQGRL